MKPKKTKPEPKPEKPSYKFGARKLSNKKMKTYYEKT